MAVWDLIPVCWYGTYFDRFVRKSALWDDHITVSWCDYAKSYHIIFPSLTCDVCTFLHVSAVFKDVNTPSPFVEEFPTFEPSEEVEFASAALPDHIYMDAMAFGMGCCCLQMTFQACNICEARHLYDQLSPMCPIMVCRINYIPLLEYQFYCHRRLHTLISWYSLAFSHKIGL